MRNAIFRLKYYLKCEKTPLGLHIFRQPFYGLVVQKGAVSVGFFSHPGDKKGHFKNFAKTLPTFASLLTNL